jgi:hypothetical protein
MLHQMKVCLKPSLDPKYTNGLNFKTLYQIQNAELGAFRRKNAQNAEQVMFVSVLNSRWELITMPAFNFLFIPLNKEEEFKEKYDETAKIFSHGEQGEF